MAKCYVKAFICDEMDGCEIVNSCGLRDNEELAAETEHDMFDFLRNKLGAGAFECLVEVEITGTSSFDGEYTEYDVDFCFELIDFEKFPEEEKTNEI